MASTAVAGGAWEPALGPAREDGRLVSTLAKRDAERLIKAGVIDGGMLPKVESSLRALAGGAQKAHIIDGRVAHAILLEVLTKEGIGTEIVL